MGRTLSGDSANVIALPASPTGFTAGDYVYQTSSGYGAVPAGALSTGMFDAPSVPFLVSSSTSTSFNELTYVEQLGGSQGSQVAAQLTNGNIVYAYATGNTTTYSSAATVNFRIETSSGTPVVVETSTTMTAYGPFQVGVIALPAGGFAIVCTPTAAASPATSFNLNARFYNADGTAATAVLNAAATIVGNTTTTSRLRLQALTDGSVIIGYINNTTFELRKVTTAGFDATFGTTGVATVQVFTSASQWWDVVTDSSNNIHTISTTATTSLTMRRYNSSGVQQATSTVSSLTGVTALAIAISSSGTIRGFVQDSTGIAVVTWDGTTAALGTRIITAASVPTNGALGAFAQGASDGYVVFYNATLPSNSAIGLYFQAFNSSNVALASATRVNPAIAVNYRNQFVPIVVSGNTRVYFGVFQSNAVGYTSNASVPPMGIAYFAYSNTTYALVGSSNINYNYGSAGPYALGAYMRSASTAAIAKFTIATTGAYTASYAAGATIIPKTFVDGTNICNRLLLAPLPNGEFVAAWARQGSPYTTFISKYSATGALLAGPVTVNATGSSGISDRAVSVTPFANGNILVTYADSTATTLRYRIYTSSLTVVTSGDVLTGINLNNPNVAASSFGDGSHVALAFANGSSNIASAVVRNNGTVTSVGPTLTAGTAWTTLQIIGFKSSSFAVAAQLNDGTTTVWGYVVRQTGATTFLGSPGQRIFASGFNTMGYAASNPTPSSGTAGYFVGNGAGAAGFSFISVNPLLNTDSQLNTQQVTGSPFGSISVTTNTTANISYTPNGTPVLTTNGVFGAATNFITLAPFSMKMTGSTTTITGPVVTTLSTASANRGVCAIPHLGEAVIIGYSDTNGYPAFASIAVSAFSGNLTLTAGTDISTSALGLTPEGGYSLQGVSVTAAASGSSGLVQTRGTAALNSSYSAATPATLFDFRNPFTFGVNGTVIGRTVIMGNN